MADERRELFDERVSDEIIDRIDGRAFPVANLGPLRDARRGCSCPAGSRRFFVERGRLPGTPRRGPHSRSIGLDQVAEQDSF